MLPPKINHWLQQGRVPARLLLSGGGDLFSVATNLAAELLQVNHAELEKGILSDVKVCRSDGKSLKIGDRDNPEEQSVRGLIKWLNQKPVASHRVLVLEHFERTSRDALQAWLKILEEPPVRAQFIFTTRNHHQLPTTILSRMTALPVSLETPALVTTEAQSFLENPNLITQFQIIDQLDKSLKDEPQNLENFMHGLLQASRQNPRLQTHLPRLFKAQQDLNRNVNRRLVLEHLALQLQKQ